MSGPVAEPIERPSGSYVSVTNDGFEVQSNVGTEDDLRRDLGVTPKESKDGEAVQELPSVSKPRRPREDPDARKKSLQAEIDAHTERRRVAKEEADAEEARLTKLRSESQPRDPQREPHRAIEQPREEERPKAAAYDGSDAADPEPTIEKFADQADPYTAHLYARQEWLVRKQGRVWQHQQTEGARRTRAEQVYEHRVGELTRKLKEHESKEPDFKSKIDPEIAKSLTWTTPDTQGTPLGDLVMDADNPAELMVYFSANKAEFQRITALHPLKQAMELGEIRGMLRASSATPMPKPKAVSQAKGLVKTLDTTPQRGEDTRPDEELTEEEHEARHAKMRKMYR